METQTINRTTRTAKLQADKRERLTAYFMHRYPSTKKIKVGTNNKRAYTARVNYREGNVNRCFSVQAYTYEGLVICLHLKYKERGLDA